ncbi:PREDICTED: transmembrane protein 234 homolog isoform X2 [Nelumbo nucifera]|uniref:Transmembrane protein 234 homolog isoform X2 n=2 Tax=Nelumbo nucifera TaxID=4432 RepID=A0A1U7ZZ84_NELNU|nr:PREDICTED: transmembrane protein 234 homolog isoform X2 [Nelumbo nucifera]
MIGVPLPVQSSRTRLRVETNMSDVGKMIAIGVVWGVTNAIMRRGALIWDKKLQSPATNPAQHLQLHQQLLGHLKNWLNLLFIWQYSIPFFVNLSASAAFFVILSESPISLAVPVTNATTFAATAVSAMLLGEETRIGFAFVGTFLIVLGVWICIM